jgi:predicted DNA-binding WGR domain protein
MHDVILYRVDAGKNMWRYYRLDLQPDLFGLWLLVKEWGRIGQPGQSHMTSFATIDDAQRAFELQRRIKERRGYSHQQQVAK